jgi:nucleotide-binding universal stress UspA family protein
MREDIFETVFVPIANPKDAEETARAIHRYSHNDSEIIVAHAIEKGEGVPDKASVEQREQYAEKAYNTFLEVFPDGWGTVRFVTLYGRNVAETIVEGAVDAEATVIAFTPRGGSRWKRLVTGDIARHLLENTEVPVISLPKQPKRIVLD